MICYDCGMSIEPSDYHPSLYCVIFKAFDQDPVEVLSEHGYTRDEPWEPIKVNPPSSGDVRDDFHRELR